MAAKKKTKATQVAAAAKKRSKKQRKVTPKGKSTKKKRKAKMAKRAPKPLAQPPATPSGENVQPAAEHSSDASPTDIGYDDPVDHTNGPTDAEIDDMEVEAQIEEDFEKDEDEGYF